MTSVASGMITHPPELTSSVSSSVSDTSAEAYAVVFSMDPKTRRDIQTRSLLRDSSSASILSLYILRAY